MKKTFFWAGLVFFSLAAGFCLYFRDAEKTESAVKRAAETANAELSYREGFSCCRIDDTVKQRVEGLSYKDNSHIVLKQLRYITIRYYSFDGQAQDGELIVNQRIAEDILEIFYELYQHRYPLEKVTLIDEYGADDERSMQANNTSAFNYREIAGTKTLSSHACGMAVDINPRINPCVTPTGVSPKNGTEYMQRDPKKCQGKYKDYMIQKDDYIYTLFKEHGFQWGGDWETVKDYQHFEKLP